MNRKASAGERIFRQLLRLFPADFRGDFGDEMTETFREQREEALARGGTMARVRMWSDTIRGIAATAPREHLDVFRQDLKYGLRMLRRNPSFTVVAVLALAVGIGANAAVFSVVNGALFKALPYSAPEQLVTMFEKVPGAPVEKFGFSPPDFEILRGEATSFSGLAAYRNIDYELSGIGQSDRVTAARVSPSLFAVLGVGAALGRTLTEVDDRSNAPVAVLSFGTWAGALGRDPNVIGRTISLDRLPHTVVGVMSEWFSFPPRGSPLNGQPAALFVPIAFTPFERQAFGQLFNHTVVGRLKPGVTLAAARAELETLRKSVGDAYPIQIRELGRQLQFPLSRLDEEAVGRSRRLLLVLLGAVAIVLLIACTDVANLILTRAGSRQRELAIRSAIGASPGRVARQLFTESFVLAAIAAAVGLLVAYGMLRTLLSLAGPTLPRVESITFDSNVVLFTVAIGLATPFVFGLLPAMHTRFAPAADALKEGAHTTFGPGRHRLLRALVIAQAALALILSVGAGLFVRSFVRLLATDPGFRSDHVVSATTTLPTGRYSTGRMVKAFVDEAIAAGRQTPGVVYVGASTDRPLNIRERRAFTPDDTARPLPELTRTIAATWTVGQYFDAIGIPLKRGRFFTDSDGKTGQRVAIVNQILADRVWPGADPIGRQLKWGGPASRAPWMTVVGVVGDVKEGPLDRETIPLVYAPLAQEVPDAMGGVILPFYSQVNLVARTSGDSGQAMGSIRSSLRRLDPDLPPPKMEKVADIVTDSVRPQRFSMSVISAFAVVALMLAVIGIYGVLANVVVQQTREIGVRVALGATRNDLLWLVLRRALVMTGSGIAIGTVVALSGTRVMAGLLYEIRPTDAVAFGGSIVLLSSLVIAASLVPAWRATRIDPLLALRSE